ncbi:MAG TPA: hypothetical protein VIZ65_08340 [Cellvibrionaceae bacterium]
MDTESLLPVVLAGPIVRRAEKNAIWIWICTSKSVNLEIFTFDNTVVGAKPTGRGSSTTIVVGENCYVHLIKILPFELTFLNHQKIYYDIREHTEDAKFASFGTWSIESWVALNSITIASEKLPSIALNYNTPSSDKPLRGFFSSCRKAGGEGKDAIGLAKAIWAKGQTTGKEFSPYHLNLMIGDQIYADDVRDSIFQCVRKLASRLMGFEESFVCDQGTINSATGQEKRKSILRKLEFTSDTDNHCVLFGEYIALYCLCFSSKKLDDDFAEPAIGSYIKRQFDTVFKSTENYRFEKWMEGKENLRFIFANVPTYFMLDDHEVTDDWNLNQNWKDKIKHIQPMADIIRHALTGYFLFQGWGNQPESYTNEQCSSISKRLFDRARENKKKGINTFPIKEIIDWHWDYQSPTIPPFNILDTRTYRCNSTITVETLAEILGATAKDISYEWKKAAKGVRDLTTIDQGASEKLRANLQKQAEAKEPNKFEYFCILVSPCTVFSADASRTADILFKDKTLVDSENWDLSHPDSVKLLLQPVISSGFQRVLFISGDIHYGYINTGTVTSKNSAHRLEIIEAVSSPSLNFDSKVFWGTYKFQDTQRIARWYLPEGKSRYASGNLLDPAIKKSGEPDYLVTTTRRDGDNRYNNNIGTIEISGSKLDLKLHST